MTDPSTPATPATPTVTPSASAATSAPPAVTAPGTALDIAHMLHSNTINAEQAGRLSKAGNVSNLDVARALHTLHQIGDAQPDTRTAEAKQFDAAYPVAKESEFNPVQYYPPGQAPAVLPQEVQIFDANRRAWMGPEGAGLSVEAGNAIESTMSRVLQETKGMNDDQLEGYRQSQLQLLQQAHGDELQARLKLADDMIEELELRRPGLFALLETKGIGKSALVWNLLLSHAPIYHARKGW
ncbi:MAG: hypothetical protein ND866_08020 [Pyrinomonadaceae bacterium]|nr:hypothetical protein [Pyrinomonadaceae bacterium]